MCHHPVPSESMSSRINAQTSARPERRRKSGEVTAPAGRGLCQVGMTPRSCKTPALLQHSWGSTILPPAACCELSQHFQANLPHSLSGCRGETCSSPPSSSLGDCRQ